MYSLASSFFISLLSTAFGATTKDDLYQSLDTVEKCWIVQRSYQPLSEHGAHMCVYAMKDSLSMDSYSFEEYYKEEGTWKSEHFSASLEENGVLTVSQKSSDVEGAGARRIQYTLEYWDSAKRCGVITFIDPENNQLQCELHILESGLRNYVGYNYPCELEYDRICAANHKYTVYTVDCLS